MKHAVQNVEGRPLGVVQNRSSGVVALHLPGRLRKQRPSAPSRWRRNAERTRSVGCHESDVDFSQLLDVARSPQVAVAASEGNVKAKPSNKPINPTPFAASRRLLTQATRRGSCAGYRHR